MATRLAEVTGIRARLASALEALVRAGQHPAAWVFAIIYGASATILVISGHAPLLAIELGLAGFLAALLLVTVALTAPDQLTTLDGDDASFARDARVWGQLGLLSVVVLFTLYGGMVFNGVAPRIPGLFDGVQSVYRLSTLLLNPTLYVILPALLLFVLGARLRTLGIARGRRARAASALWSVGPVIGIGIALVVGHLSMLRLLSILIGNTLRSGPMEEFLWRGAVLTRLRLVVGAPWGIVISSLAFGIWHIGTNVRSFGGQLAPAMAYCVVSQATIGLAFGLLFVRTHNLLAPSVAHVLLDTVSGLLG